MRQKPVSGNGTIPARKNGSTTIIIGHINILNSQIIISLLHLAA
jgi:hypothetical protein